MTNLLDSLVSYLALHTDSTAGENIFYNSMPDDPDECILVQEEQTNYSVPAQIDAEVHRVRVTVRSTDTETAYALAKKCWRWLFTDDEEYDTNKEVDTTGFIIVNVSDRIQVRLYGNPIWDKADQQGRQYYCFYAHILTSR